MSGLTGSPLLRPTELLASLTETFTSGLSTVRSPSPLPDITTVATGRFHRRVPPAGSAASVAAPVLDLHPVLRPSGPIGPIRTLRHQALKAHVACRLEQVGADFALLIGGREDAVRATGEQAREVGLAHGQRQPAETIQRQDIEGIKRS